MLNQQRTIGWELITLKVVSGQVVTPTTGHHIETHCGEHCVDWEGLIPTHYITRYPAAATVCFNMVCYSKLE